MYSEEGIRYDIYYETWCKIKDSNEYLLASGTWHGKHKKKKAEWAGWGKREVREAWRKYKVLKNNKIIKE